MVKKAAIPPKKERLTLKQLTDYDDILTDALVDHVHFWDKIRKTTGKKYSSKRMSQDEIRGIILQEVVCNKDLLAAERRLLKMPALAAFMSSLKPNEKEDFKRHLRKYIEIWSTDSPWEVTTTNRYTIISHEAAVTARRAIRKGESIKYLCGTLVAITPEEEKVLDISSRDFSIVMSSRKRTPSLFLGPARFANHDCDANAKLVTVGQDAMQVVAVRNVARNEEITVTYGEDYFGERNCECLCKTCEMAGRGAWIGSGQQALLLPAQTDEDQETSKYRFRNKRRRDENSSGGVTPEVEDLRLEKRRKSLKESPLRQAVISPPALILKRPRGRPPKRPRWSLPVAQEHTSSVCQVTPIMISSGTQTTERTFTSASTQTLPGSDDETLIGELNHVAMVHQQYSDPLVQPHDPLEVLPIAVEQQLRSNDSPFTDANAFSGRDSQLLVKPESADKQPLRPSSLSNLVAPEMDREQHSLPSSLSNEQESIFERDHDRASTPASTPRIMAKEETTGFLATAVEAAAEISTSEASHIKTELDPPPPSTPQPTPGTLSSPAESVSARKMSKIMKQKLGLDDGETCVSVTPPRRPGDYIRPAFLISQPAAIWAECQTCSGTFAQQDGYTIRKECPRCERHSIVYGFQWPKTDNAEGESATRIMDHRTVHRFLGPKQMSRVRRGLSAIGSDGETSEEEEGGGRRKKSGRVKWCY